jgi:cytochrome c oxidase subunit 2
VERSERLWFGFLILVFLAFNVLTLSPIVPWQRWMLWEHPTPDQVVPVQFGDYQIGLPPGGVEVAVGQYVEFVATSSDVTYGFGVFRQDGRMLFQMQVLPGHENSIVWRFSEPGLYHVRSTEYSGPRHPEMFLDNAISVTP